jgi:hypothetical protein
MGRQSSKLGPALGSRPGVRSQHVTVRVVGKRETENLRELESEIRMMLQGVEGGLGRVNKIMRGELIAALEILLQRVPHGEWQNFLKAHRLNPSTVRNWRARGRGQAIRLRHIVGEFFPPREPRRKEPTSESVAMQLAKAENVSRKLLFKGMAVMRGN